MKARIVLVCLLGLAGALRFPTPAGSVPAPQGSRPALLVLNKSESMLAIIDPASLQVIGRVATGEGPHELTVSSDGRFAFVGNYGTVQNPGNSLSVIDVAARKETRRVVLPGLVRPHGMTEAGGKIFFTSEASRAIARYDPATDRIDWIMGTGQSGTHMLVVTPDQKKIYTANRGSNSVTAIQPGAGDNLQVVQIAVGQGPEGIGLSPGGKELWVAHRGDGGLSIVDTATNSVSATIKVGQAPIRVKFTPDGKRALISDATAGEVVVLDAETRKEIKRIKPFDAPVGILIQPDGKRAFVASTRANKVMVLDLETLSVVGAIEPGREPDGLAWAGR